MCICQAEANQENGQFKIPQQTLLPITSAAMIRVSFFVILNNLQVIVLAYISQVVRWSV